MKVYVRIIVLLAGIMSLTYCASVGNRHPDYPNALESLRAARSLIDQPATRYRTMAQDDAVEAINGAIREIKSAAIEVGSDTEQVPAAGELSGQPGRFHDALELLSKARVTIDQDEDYYFASTLRNHTLGHIDTAIQATRRALVD